MQQLFPQNNQTNPSLRFKNSNGENYPDWEIKKLGEIGERITRKNKEHNTNVLTISSQYGLINQEEFFNKKIAVNNLQNYYLLYQNEFAYNKSYSKGYPMGAIKKLSQYDKGIVSTLYITFKINNENDVLFLEKYFDSGLQNIELEKIAKEGARDHGLLNIGVNDFFQIKIYIPHIEEQNKIGKFLKAVDDKIEITNQKLKHLKTYKTSLMQQLFPSTH